MIGLTIHGQGGGKELWWLTNAGGKSWSEIAQYNFELVIGQTGWQSTPVGSFATSDSFTIKNGQTLAVGAGITTAHAPSQGYTDVGFGVLLQNKKVAKVLFAFRPDGSRSVGGGPGPTVLFAAASADVLVTQVFPQQVAVAPYVLNGVNYSQNMGAGTGNISTQLTATCQPDPGEYELLFGAFAIDGSVMLDRPSALVVQGIAVI